MKRKSLLFIPLDWHKKNVQMPFFEGLSTQFDCRYYMGAGADLMRNKPDIIMIWPGAISISELTALKKLTKAKVIQWTGDAREEPLEIVTRYKGLVDRTFLAAGIGQHKEYERELEHPVFWLQHCADKFLLPKKMNKNDKSIAFVGNYYDQFPGGFERNLLCRDLDMMYNDNFFCFGSWSDSRGSVPYDDTPWIYNNAYVCISANIFNDIEGYWSNRPYDIMAAGSCCLMRYVPGYERHFTDMVNVVVYKSNDEAIEKIEWLYKNAPKRNKIALAGYKHVLANHTYINRAAEIWANI